MSTQMFSDKDKHEFPRIAMTTPTPETLAAGDPVEVLCPGLAMLRRLMPNMPPNHHGTVAEVWADGQILVEFPLSGDNHSQVAPYPKSMVRKRTISPQPHKHNERIAQH